MRRILVVGGGPAGMEAARVAARRGHRVTLAEQGDSLGGRARFSAIVDPQNNHLIDSLKAQMKNLAVDVQLQTRVDCSYIENHRPDAVVVASGGRWDAPPVLGVDQRHVFSGDELCELGTAAVAKLAIWQRCLLMFARLLRITRSAALMRRISRLWMPPGREACIVGGGLVGLELAVFLAERGRKVSVLEAGEAFGMGIGLTRRSQLLEELRELSVVLINKTRLLCIEGKTLRLSSAGCEVDIRVDTVFFTVGAPGNLSLAEQSGSLGIETHVVGDCGAVGYIEGAIHSANAVARGL